MKYTFALATLAAAVSASDLIDTLLVARQDNSAETYINEVCFPNTTNPVPPCQAIVNIESACQPNGTAAIDYEAHQQCMCNGGYFSNWKGCLNCQYVHGTRSEAVAEAFDNILSSASSQFCGTATPTAKFADYFSAVSDSAPQTATGAATTTSDQFPSQSAVSLYYTASGPQGPGAITGSATGATATGSTAAASRSTSLAAGAASSVSTGSASGSMTTSHRSSSSSGSGSSSSSASKSSTGSATGSAASTSSTGAANAVVVSQGLMAIVAGGMMLL